MKKIKFIQIKKENEEHFQLFKSLMIPYNNEQDSHRPWKEKLSNETIIKYTQGMMNMQGAFDRHLELCFYGEKLIGFHYGKVDHMGHLGFIKPEYGYIMEFYIIPEYRRQGYGKAMFERLESLFAAHGVKRMYLNPDPVTGVPFWRAMGFEGSGEISPVSNSEIFEKDVTCKNVSYKIYESLHEKSDEIFAKIAKLRWNIPDEKMSNTVDWMKKNNFGENLGTPWFEVVAYNSMNEIVGFSFFMQNPNETAQWYLGDLIIAEGYRRLSIATNIINIGLSKVSGYGGKSIFAYIEKDNIASTKLHEKIGFRNLKRLEPFAEFVHGDDQTTFEYKF